MIPTRKKTPEELAALRDGLGLFQNPDSTSSANPDTQPSPSEDTPPPFRFQKVIGRVPLPTRPQEPAPPAEATPKKRAIQTLRKVELPLFPAQEVPHKTDLPRRRRSHADLAELQRREALANFSATPTDPAVHLKKLTAHPILLALAYLPAFGAIYTAWNAFHFITPLSLIFVSGLLTTYIFWKKMRSRHHAAILLIILVMTLVFGGIHYAPYFSAYAT